LQYFYGDNQNAVQIQIWTTRNALLLHYSWLRLKNIFMLVFSFTGHQ